MSGRTNLCEQRRIVHYGPKICTARTIDPATRRFARSSTPAGVTAPAAGICAIAESGSFLKVCLTDQLSRFSHNARYDVVMLASSFVRSLRERHELSQAQLAYRAGTTQQAVSRIERGLVSPSVEFLGRLAASCGEELELGARPRSVPFEEAQLLTRLARSPAELSFSWNKLAGDLAGAGARARGALRQ